MCPFYLSEIPLCVLHAHRLGSDHEFVTSFILNKYFDCFLLIQFFTVYVLCAMHKVALRTRDANIVLIFFCQQIVIQIGEEVDGMIMIRDGENRQGACPLKYLTEV